MHNHVANRGRKALLKQIFSVFLIFTLYFNSFNSAYAGAFGPWTITNSVAQGASTILTGSKEVILNGAKKIATGTAKITPTAAQVSKVLARGAAGYALSVAVQQLLGAVDWVLDPANNRITYTDKNVLTPADKACKEKAAQIYGPTNPWTIKAVYAASGPYKGYCVLSDNPGFNLFAAPNSDTTIPEDQKKHLPLDVVASQVITNAENGDTNAQVATTAAAADIINEAENDNVKARPIVQQLENTQSIPTDQTANGDAVPKENANTENPSSSVAAPATDLTLDFPIFCDWAPSICQAAKWVITQPQLWADAVTDSWTWTKARYEAAVTSISDFLKNEPNADSDNSLPVQDIPLPELNTGTFKATAGCPAPIPINITIGTKGTGSISYEPICQFASKWSFVAPLIGFLSAAMILVGVGRKGEDSEI
ncbi:virulence factor TspB C-terminal domain-related protein [Acinetobacter junii]|uniref:Virulence factor TspB C-terminal domain-related protein n=1 Tax=Acinetobacter junii TaxID=40215 RepID=A0ABU8ZK79_ACIJU